MCLYPIVRRAASVRCSLTPFPKNGAGGGSGWTGDRGDDEVDETAAGGVPIELGRFLLCSSKADAKSLDLAERAFALGFGDAGDEVLADIDQVLAGQDRVEEVSI